MSLLESGGRGGHRGKTCSRVPGLVPKNDPGRGELPAVTLPTSGGILNFTGEGDRWSRIRAATPTSDYDLHRDDDSLYMCFTSSTPVPLNTIRVDIPQAMILVDTVRGGVEESFVDEYSL